MFMTFRYPPFKKHTQMRPRQVVDRWLRQNILQTCKYPFNTLLIANSSFYIPPSFQRTELRLSLRRKCHGPKHTLPGAPGRAGWGSTSFNQKTPTKHHKTQALNSMQPSKPGLMNMFWILESHCWTASLTVFVRPCLMFSRTYKQTWAICSRVGHWETWIR